MYVNTKHLCTMCLKQTKKLDPILECCSSECYDNARNFMRKNNVDITGLPLARAKQVFYMKMRGYVPVIVNYDTNKVWTVLDMDTGAVIDLPLSDTDLIPTNTLVCRRHTGEIVTLLKMPNNSYKTWDVVGEDDEYDDE